MQEVFGGIFGIMLGLVLLLRKDQFVKWVIEFNNRTTPYRYGARESIIFTRVTFIVAVSSIAAGVISLGRGFGWF